MLNVSRTRRWIPLIAAALAIALSGSGAIAQEGNWPTTPPDEPPADWGPISSDLQEIEYPYPVHYLELNRFGKDMRMAYMDVPAEGTPNGQVVLIQHGMNFYSEAYGPTIDALSKAGFRVIAVDRIGYGRSSKAIVPYDFNFVVSNTKALLDELGIEKVAIVGHSMGGMVVARFAMVYPDITTHVIMVNPIGLTDQRPGRAWTDTQERYEQVYRGTSYQSILRNHMTYYPIKWRPAHLEFVRRQYGQTLGAEWPQLAMVRALQMQMLYEDPVVYDWQHITSKALIMGGEEDRLTRDFPAAARHVLDELPNGALILYPNVGHAPQYVVPDQFHADIIRFLSSDPNQPASEWE